MKKGFTLVEVIVVMVILAILAAVAIPMWQAYTLKAKAEKAAEQLPKTTDEVATQAAKVIVELKDMKAKISRKIDSLENEASLGEITTKTVVETVRVNKGWYE